MTDPSMHADLDRDDDVAPDGEDYVGAPRWVKWFAGVSLVLVILYVLVLIVSAGVGGHSPERHQPMGATAVTATLGQGSAFHPIRR